MLHKLARVGPSGGLYEQNAYFYLEDSERRPRILVAPSMLQMLLERLGGLETRDRERLELAVRWYGMSVAAGDPLDGYLAAWIGLESVGPTLDSRYHQSGPRANCPTCGNPAVRTAIGRTRAFST